MLCPLCCAHSSEQSVSDCRPAADLHGRQVAGFAHLLLRAAWCVWPVQTPTSKGLVAKQNYENVLKTFFCALQHNCLSQNSKRLCGAVLVRLTSHQHDMDADIARNLLLE
jgi:hypothetical protein